MKKFSIVLISFVLIAFAAIAVQYDSLDVIGNGSLVSFEKILKILPKTPFKQNGDWIIESPGNKTKFVLAKSENQVNENAGGQYALYLEFDIAPFLKAGLNPDKLPENIIAAKNAIVIGREFKIKKLETMFTEPGDTLAYLYQKILNSNRSAIGYHSALDHYGIDLGNGNMFEWAKDSKTNDKDIVFVLNPQPFIDAGVNPEKIDGWLYAKVPIMDAKGKKTEVFKILKPFNLD
ncbi:MAG: hypothetical protein LBV16_01755 [Elusimicrobiota bacterium]|jgi:hypothetical protein|nr:hypothetical protein [Elusimicrobiota bacterium]